MGEFNGPIVEGAYYERDGYPKICGPALGCGEYFVMGSLLWNADGSSPGGLSSLTRRVWITHTDPADVVAELRRSAASLKELEVVGG